MKALTSICLIAVSCAAGYAQTKNIEFSLMTWPELKKAIHDDGKTTALIFNGGIEQRGPQGVSGAHDFVAHALGLEIAAKLGNAILAPMIPFSVNGGASADLPGTIGVTGPVFAEVNEQEAEQLIRNGFRNVVLMGDHGGGQQELAGVAKKLDAKYSPQGIRVVYCGDVYTKVGTDFDKWLRDRNLPVGSHASIKDTSELWYLGGDKGWVRKEEIPNAVGGAAHKNGISGDARLSSPDIGKVVSDMKVDYAVAQIRQLLAPKAAEATGGQ
jgi:creatinine amidohydrolase/Fe(II)-dependent formamide hydrolase-like protein